MSFFTRGFEFGIVQGIFQNSFGFNALTNMCAFASWRPNCCWNYCNPVPQFFVPNYSNNAGYIPYLTPTPNFINFTTNSNAPNFESIPMPTLKFDHVFDFSQLPTPKLNINATFNTGDIFVKSNTGISSNYSALKTSGNIQSENKYDDIIEKYANKYGVDKYLIKAMIKQESRFNPQAVSSANAKGLMQLMPGTASDMGVTNPFDPEQNIEGGVKYIKKMLDLQNGNIKLALASYNAGAGNVKNGKIPQNNETPDYVEKVMQYYNEYKGA